MNREALQKAIDNLAIEMIYLHSTNVRMCNDFDPLVSNQQLVGQYNINTKSYCIKEFQAEGNDVKHNFLSYQTEARMRYFKGPISEELKNPENEAQLEKLIAVEIIAVFTSEYLIKCSEDLPEDAILEFGKLNVPHNVWAYWREYCHSTCARMSLPVSILPLLTMNKSTAGDKRTTEKR